MPIDADYRRAAAQLAEAVRGADPAAARRTLEHALLSAHQDGRSAAALDWLTQTPAPQEARSC